MIDWRIELTDVMSNHRQLRDRSKEGSDDSSTQSFPTSKSWCNAVVLCAMAVDKPVTQYTTNDSIPDPKCDLWSKLFEVVYRRGESIGCIDADFAKMFIEKRLKTCIRFKYFDKLVHLFKRKSS